MACGVIPIVILNQRDWVAIVFSAVIPVFVMLVTMIVTKIQQRVALKQQANEHKELVKAQNKVNRLTIMPVFGCYWCYCKNGKC